MIALDTNVLVRYLVEDDPVQAHAARTFIETKLSDDTPGFVSLSVLCELVWTLGHAYRFSRNAITGVIEALLESRQIEIERASVVALAIGDDRADLTDAIIHEVGRANGCDRTVTFDRKFARLPGVEILET